MWEWIQIVKNSEIIKHKEIIKFLKTEHNLTYGFANLIAIKSRRTNSGYGENPYELVEKQYENKKNLIPIYEKLVQEIKKFGHDIEIAQKKCMRKFKKKKDSCL